MIEHDDPCIPVRAVLRPSTYRVFAEHARAIGTDVPTLLSRLADISVRPDDKRRARDEEIDSRIRELNAQACSDAKIARQIGLAQSTVSRRRAAMGLLPPKPRAGGRQAK